MNWALVRRGDTQTHTVRTSWEDRGGKSGIAAAIQGCQNCWEPPEASKDSPLEPWEGAWPTDSLLLDF